MSRYTINHLMSISNLWHVALEFRLKNENMELNTLVILHYENSSNSKNYQTMTKAEIASEIAKTTGIDKAAVVTVIEQFMSVVKDSLTHGENVYLRGFGSFIVKTRAEKTARNISKNTTIIIPAHNIPAFKPANTFKEEVAK